jgi:hypothetical protein
MPNAGYKWRFVGSFGPIGGKIGIPANVYGSRVIIRGAVKEVDTEWLPTVEGRHNFGGSFEGAMGKVVVRRSDTRALHGLGFVLYKIPVFCNIL